MKKSLFLGCLFSLIFVSCTKESSESPPRSIEEVKMLIQRDVLTTEYEHQKEKLFTELVKSENITSNEKRQSFLLSRRVVFRDYYQNVKETYPEIQTAPSEMKAELLFNTTLIEMKEKVDDLEIRMMNKDLSPVEVDCDGLYELVDDLWDTANTLYDADLDGMGNFVVDLFDASADLWIDNCL